jgi:hypothetical protein
VPVPRALVLLLSLGTAACEPAHAPTRAPATPTAAADHRARGLAALDAGHYHLARQAFAASLAAGPDNLAARVLLDAATAALLASQREAAAAFATARPLVVAVPPAGPVVRRAARAGDDAAPRLVLVGTRPGSDLDDAAWCRSRGAELPELEVPNPMRGDPGTVPPGTPPLYGAHVLVQAIAQPGLTLLLYGPDYRGGRFVAVETAARRRLAFLDLGAFHQPAIWAAVADGALLVAHHDPAADPGTTATVTALDLGTGELLWRSPPAVASAADFVVLPAHLLVAHADRVSVLDRRTGAVISDHPLAAPPLLLLVHAGRLHVRTTGEDHEFALR